MSAHIVIVGAENTKLRQFARDVAFERRRFPERARPSSMSWMKCLNLTSRHHLYPSVAFIYCHSPYICHTANLFPLCHASSRRPYIHTWYVVGNFSRKQSLKKQAIMRPETSRTCIERTRKSPRKPWSTRSSLFSPMKDALCYYSRYV